MAQAEDLGHTPHHLSPLGGESILGEAQGSSELQIFSDLVGTEMGDVT